MVFKFPEHREKHDTAREVNIRLDMTFDLPSEMAEQLELWGLSDFDSCEFDQERCQLKMSAKSTLYQKERERNEVEKNDCFAVRFVLFCDADTSSSCGRAAD